MVVIKKLTTGSVAAGRPKMTKESGTGKHKVKQPANTQKTAQGSSTTDTWGKAAEFAQLQRWFCQLFGWDISTVTGSASHEFLQFHL